MDQEEKKMNRQGKTLFILILALLALIGSWFLIRDRNREQERKEAEEESADDTVVYAISANDITEFSYRAEGGTVSFAKTDGVWKNKEDESLELDQDAVQNYAGQLGTVIAKRILSGGEIRFEEYGFDRPVNIMEVTTPDGTKKMTFGMKNTVTGQYYMILDDNKDEVYCVETSLPEQMNRTAESFVEEEEEAPAG